MGKHRKSIIKEVIDRLEEESDAYECSLSKVLSYYTVKVLPMCWRKRNLWKVSIVIAGILLLLMLEICTPASAASAYEEASKLTGPRTIMIQVTPTVDETATVLMKDQLKLQNDKLRRDNSEYWPFLNAVGGSIGAALLAVVAFVSTLFGFTQWYRNHESDREKQAEGRFQSAVTGLGDEKEGAQVGAAILLRTFLRPGHEQFYTQTFDLAVANLRRRGASKIVQRQPWNAPQNPNIVFPLTTLDQALIVVFKEAFPLARRHNKGKPPSLDATGIQLDNAYLVGADLEQMWGPQASLRKAQLRGAQLSKAHLVEADLRWADLSGAHLSGANLRGADLRGSSLSKADLRWADLSRADLGETLPRGAFPLGALLHWANLEVDLFGTHLLGTYLRYTDLRGADLSAAKLSGVDLSAAKLGGAQLGETILTGAKGLTKKQRTAYRAKGALVDEEPTSNVSQEPVSTSLPLEPESVQPPSPQETSPAPDADQGNGISSQIAPDKGTSVEAEEGDDVGRTP